MERVIIILATVALCGLGGIVAWRVLQGAVRVTTILAVIVLAVVVGVIV